MKKGLIFLVVVAVLCALTGFAISKLGKTRDVTILKLAHGLNTQHPVHKTMEFLAQRVKEKSDGRLIVQIFPSEQLGNEKECMEALQLGYLAMTKTSAAPMESFVPQIRIFGIPYLFRDSEHFWKVARGPIGKKLLAAGRDKQLLGLCYYDAGARSFYAKKEIRSPADLEGMKIRVMQSVMAMDMIRAMGGNPTPISWGELYTALDQGTVDAAENNPPSFDTSRHYEICDYYILDEHQRVPDILVISTKVWDGLSPEFQQILQEAVDESVDYNRKLWNESEEESLKKVEAAGVTIIRPDKKFFQEAVQSMWDKYRDTDLGELIQRIQEVE